MERVPARPAACRRRSAPAGDGDAVRSIPDVLPAFGEATCCRCCRVRPRIWIGNRIRVSPHCDLMENVALRRRRAAAVHAVSARAGDQPLPRPVRADPGRHAGQHGRSAATRSRALSALRRSLGDARSRPSSRRATRSTSPTAGGTASTRSSRSASWSTTGGTTRRASISTPTTRCCTTSSPSATCRPSSAPCGGRCSTTTSSKPNGDPAAHLPEHARGMMGAPTPSCSARLRATLRKIVG